MMKYSLLIGLALATSHTATVESSPMNCFSGFRCGKPQTHSLSNDDSILKRAGSIGAPAPSAAVFGHTTQNHLPRVDSIDGIQTQADYHRVRTKIITNSADDWYGKSRLAKLERVAKDRNLFPELPDSNRAARNIIPEYPDNNQLSNGITVSEITPEQGVTPKRRVVLVKIPEYMPDLLESNKFDGASVGTPTFPPILTEFEGSLDETASSSVNGMSPRSSVSSEPIAIPGAKEESWRGFDGDLMIYRNQRDPYYLQIKYSPATAAPPLVGTALFTVYCVDPLRSGQFKWLSNAQSFSFNYGFLVSDIQYGAQICRGMNYYIRFFDKMGSQLDLIDLGVLF